MAEEQAPEQKPTGDPDLVWTYRGYKMRVGEFNTAMVHFYRGEVSRSNAWRQRLDSTTNWAVVTTAGILSFAFGSATNSHVVILIGMLMLTLFLIVESRRYRYYELWALRVRLMETDFFAAMLNPPFAPHHEWASRLADTLLTPSFPITLREAIGRRLRRNYIWLFFIFGVSWAFKLMLHPTPARSVEAFIQHADIGALPGIWVAFAVTGFFFVIFLIAVLTAAMRQSAGEVLPRHEALDLSSEFFQSIATAASQVLPGELGFKSRHEQLAIIITDKAEAVSQQLLSMLSRGVTALEGKGMYSGTPRSVLLCAIAPAEVERLKAAVYAADEKAFVVVNTTTEILGAGFAELEPRWRRKHKKAPKNQ